MSSRGNCKTLKDKEIKITDILQNVLFEKHRSTARFGHKVQKIGY